MDTRRFYLLYKRYIIEKKNISPLSDGKKYINRLIFIHQYVFGMHT